MIIRFQLFQHVSSINFMESTLINLKKEYVEVYKIFLFCNKKYTDIHSIRRQKYEKFTQNWRNPF